MDPPTSSRSNKSGKSYVTGSDNEEIDLELYLTELYKRYNCPIFVSLEKVYPQRGQGTKTNMREIKTKYNRISIISPDFDPDEDSEVKFDLVDTEAENSLPITAVYDSTNHLTEIRMAQFRHQVIPRMIIHLIGLVLSQYTQLNKFTIKNCRIDMFTVNEFGKVLPFTTITHVCLDDCPLTKGNYKILLSNPSCLKNLSLCRCQINDDECEGIASKLCYLEPAEETLIALNLTSNRIGDEGAKHLAQALRSNRHLRYLNLADNNISDEGVNHIFHTLTEFPLTYDENMDRRHRLMLHLKKKQKIYLDCLQKFNDCIKSPMGSSQSEINKIQPPKINSHVKSKTSINKEGSTLDTISDIDYIPMKAEMIAKELVGPFVDPFCSSSVRIKDGYPHCIGNFTLCYLNVAYNDLSYMSVKKLLSIVEYQHDYCTHSNCGLMKVILDGNYLPVNCVELTTINDVLNKHMAYSRNNIPDRRSRKQEKKSANN